MRPLAAIAGVGGRHGAPMIAVVAIAASLLGCPLGRGNKQVGEACADNNQCAGARCSDTSKICTKHCATDADCGGGLVCIGPGESKACEKR